jgi:hypothetical protein
MSRLRKTTGKLVRRGKYELQQPVLDLPNLAQFLAVEEAWPGAIPPRLSFSILRNFNFSFEEKQRVLQALRTFEQIQFRQFARIIDIDDRTDPTGNDICVVCEWMEGQSLREVITEAQVTGKKCDLTFALYVLKTVARAANTLHETRVSRLVECVHSAISPDTVWIDDGGDIKIYNHFFGLIRGLEKGRSIEETEDIRSLGELFWYLVTGNPIGENDPDAIAGISAEAQEIFSAAGINYENRSRTPGCTSIREFSQTIDRVIRTNAHFCTQTYAKYRLKTFQEEEEAGPTPSIDDSPEVTREEQNYNKPRLSEPEPEPVPPDSYGSPSKVEEAEETVAADFDPAPLPPRPTPNPPTPQPPKRSLTAVQLFLCAVVVLTVGIVLWFAVRGWTSTPTTPEGSRASKGGNSISPTPTPPNPSNGSQPTPVHLQVKASQPSTGMSVTIDGNRTLSIPAGVDLMPGSYKLQFQAPNYLPQTRTENIEPGMTTINAPELKPAGPRTVEWDAATARSKLDKNPPLPDYPSVICADRLFGPVNMDVIVGPTGSVERVDAAPGTNAAVAKFVAGVVRGYHYKSPTDNGQAAKAHTTVTLNLRDKC